VFSILCFVANFSVQEDHNHKAPVVDDDDAYFGEEFDDDFRDGI